MLQVVAEYENRNMGVYVITLKQYLKNFWPDLTAAHDLFESLAAALDNAESAKGS